MYYVDTRAQRVDLFDFDVDTGQLTNRRCFVSIDSREGTPDGLAVDIEGSLWLAVFGSGAVYRFDHRGAADGQGRTPMFIRDELYFRWADHGGAVRDHRAIGLDRAAKDGPAFGGVDLPGRGGRTRAKRHSF